MDQRNLVFSENVIDDDLQKMVQKVMESDYRSLIDWIVDYRYRSYDKKTFLELEKDFALFREDAGGLVKEYKRLLRWSRLEEAEHLYNTDIVQLIAGFRDKYRYILKHNLEMYEKLDAYAIQRLNNIEIPLIFRYSLVQGKKVGLNLISGFSANIVAKNHTLIKFINTDESFDAVTLKINHFNVSGTFGLGLEYPVFSRVSITLEPTLKYFINSINIEGYAKVHPYTFEIIA